MPTGVGSKRSGSVDESDGDDIRAQEVTQCMNDMLAQLEKACPADDITSPLLGSPIMTPVARHAVVAPAVDAPHSTLYQTQGLDMTLFVSPVGQGLTSTPTKALDFTSPLMAAEQPAEHVVGDGASAPIKPVVHQQAAEVVASPVRKDEKPVIEKTERVAPMSVRIQHEETSNDDSLPAASVPLAITNGDIAGDAVALPVSNAPAITISHGSVKSQALPAGMSRAQIGGALVAALGLSGLAALLSISAWRQRCGVALSLFTQKNKTLWKTMQPAQRMRTIAVLAGLLASSACVVGGSVIALA